ncbi:MAG: RluA family pseudouridine synthase [Pseudomonadota bacterium]
MRRPKQASKLRVGTKSKAPIPPYKPTDADRAAMDAALIHEDRAVLAFDKPSGLPCQTRNPDDRTLDKVLAVYAKSNGKQPRLVHRLDAQTSGVIVTARTKPAAAFLSEAFAERWTQKTYLALVSGKAFDTAAGVIDAPLERYQEKPNLALMRATALDAPGAQAARTRYELVSSNGRHHALRLFPETGRMHQIRAHLSHIGRPILGDPYYGGAGVAAGEAVDRLMLHAARLIIPHPDGGELDLSAEPPADMARLAAALELSF